MLKLSFLIPFVQAIGGPNCEWIKYSSRDLGGNDVFYGQTEANMSY